MAPSPSSGHRAGALAARPRQPGRAPGSAQGTQVLGLGEGRDGLLYAPASVDPAKPAPLVVLLHGAGGRAPDIANLMADVADARGILLLVPESRGRTWDVILGGYGADVTFIDRALDDVFSRWSVDPERVAVGGFSDGASYALSLGISNGDLFRDVLAFSPGFAAPGRVEGRSRMFVSHGISDRVLPIDPCSRRLVPALREEGYDVDYREFDGGHVVPPEMVAAAVARFLA